MTKPAAKRPQGRPELPEAERLVVVPIRLSTAQKAKLTTLGGAAWIRARIDRAKVA